MALGPVLATQLNTGAAHPWGLFVAGLDVIPSTPIERVTVTHRGPNAPGSMAFTCEDLAGTMAFSEGDEVRLHNFTTDRPAFLGFVETAIYRPRSDAVGRDIVVTAVDVDAVLDWLVLPADASTASFTGNMTEVIQRLVAMCQGVGFPLRAFAGTAANTPSTQALPIQVFVAASDVQTVARGTSLRDALRQYAGPAYFNWPPTSGDYDLLTPSFMVDEYGGLRAWGKSNATDAVLIPTDWATITIVDTTAGAVRAEGLEHTLDGVGVVRTLVLVGLDFVRTFTDGSGRVGRMSVVTDTRLTASMDPLYIAAYARDYLAGFGVRYRGTIPLTDWTPTVGAHVAGLVDLTDANAGATGIYTIGQIDRTFNDSNREDWTITYGGIRASAAALIRRLTRATPS